jgi:hypothetical protein
MLRISSKCYYAKMIGNRGGAVQDVGHELSISSPSTRHSWCWQSRLKYNLFSISMAFLAVNPAHADTKAVSATIFLSSLGIVTHVGQGYSAPNYVPMLRYTGIRAVRDNYQNTDGLLLLHEQTGVVFDVVTGCDVPSTLAAARRLASVGALLAVEGANEPNTWPITFNGQKGGGAGSWAAVASCQAALYAAVKADAVLNEYPVFHVSEGGAETDNVGMQFLTIPPHAGTTTPTGTRFADYANPHNYVTGHLGRYVANMPWSAADPTLNGGWDGLYGEYGRTWLKGYGGYSGSELETLPRVSTETGWDSVADAGGEVVQGKVLSNVYLAQFARGWRYTFIYEMIDAEGSAGAQGLYRADRSAKPAATFIHNLTTILVDNGKPASTASLSYSISNQRSTVHDLLLQKSDGTFELIIWGEQVLGSNHVTVSFDKPFTIAKVYDITIGTTALQTLRQVAAVPLSVSDHALILELQGPSR